MAGTQAMDFEGATVLTSTPLYSNTTITTWWPSVWVGATQIIMRKFNAERANELIRDYQVTHAMLVPVQYQRMWAAENHTSANWTSVRWLLSTSAPLSAAMKEKILADTDAQLLEFYGLTEGGVATTLVARKAAELGKLASVGQVQPGGELRILGENGEQLGPLEAGEIVGRTGIMSDGYLNREEATRAMHWFDEDGQLFYRSGDVGYLDEDGWLFLSDRIKDMILSGGQNIYATDLEQALNAAPDVVESAVVARPSDHWGETPWAFVVKQSSSVRSEDDIRREANGRLSSIQAIAGVTFINELPRSDIGKILKRQLREAFTED
jgi:acyl-CoA synthetase (AMP-forming)/AMP-acid ligase II